MAKFYLTRLPDGSVTYGRLTGPCFLKFHKYLGIKTPDVNANCMCAALEEVRKLDEEPDIKIYFNDTPPERIYTGGL